MDLRHGRQVGVELSPIYHGRDQHEDKPPPRGNNRIYTTCTNDNATIYGSLYFVVSQISNTKGFKSTRLRRKGVVAA